MDRTRFYNIDTTTGTPQLDFLYNALSVFTLKYPVGYYRVTNVDLVRPDLISAKMYDGNVKYWWVILLFNGIRDPFTDMQLGQILQIPNVIDLYEIFKQYKLR
jgi:hypothetical protein